MHHHVTGVHFFLVIFSHSLILRFCEAEDVSDSPALAFHKRTKHTSDDSSLKEEEPSKIPPNVFYYEDHVELREKRKPWEGLNYHRIQKRVQEIITEVAGVENDPSEPVGSSKVDYRTSHETGHPSIADAKAILMSHQHQQKLDELKQVSGAVLEHVLEYFDRCLQDFLFVINHALVVTEWKSVPGFMPWSLRVYPSSGALYGTETYFKISYSKVGHHSDHDWLHFDVQEASLRRIEDGISENSPPLIVPNVTSDPNLEPEISGAFPSFSLFLSTIWQRQTFKYGERGLRYCLLDVGHVLAAVEFACEQVGAKLATGIAQPATQSQSQTEKTTKLWSKDFEKVPTFLTRTEVPLAGPLQIQFTRKHWEDLEKGVRNSVSEHGRNPLLDDILGRIREEIVGAIEGQIMNDHGNSVTQSGSVPMPQMADGKVSKLRSSYPSRTLQPPHDFYGNSFYRYPVIMNLTHQHHYDPSRFEGRFFEHPYGISSRREKMFVDSDRVPGRSVSLEKTIEMDLDIFKDIVFHRRTARGFVMETPPLEKRKFEVLIGLLQGRRDVVFFIHNVEGYEAGIYFLQSNAEDLYRLPGSESISRENVRILAQNAACGQKLGGNGYFAIGIIGNVSGDVARRSQSISNYFDEHILAGRLGHRVYVGVEYLRSISSVDSTSNRTIQDSNQRSIQASGIGCFIDSYYEEVLGIGLDPKQAVLYMMAVGYPEKVSGF